MNVKPIFRWAGSKRQIVSLLARFWSNKFDRYIEPFAGSACLFFYLMPKCSIINDINPWLIEAYQFIKRYPLRVHQELAKMVISKEEYYKVRALKPLELSSVKRVTRFIYLNRYCFNGLYRTNKSGDFNVPYGGIKSGKLPSLKDLKNWSLALNNTSLYCLDFQAVADLAKKNDFVYLDPPYNVTTKKIFGEYHAIPFSQNDVFRLKETMTSMDEKGVKFIVSYALSKESNTLIKGFNSNEVIVRRNIAGFSNNRKAAKEVLITNIENVSF